MEYVSNSEMILKWLVAFGAIVMMLFLLFGWLKGIYWEKDLRMKRRHR